MIAALDQAVANVWDAMTAAESAFHVASDPAFEAAMQALENTTERLRVVIGDLEDEFGEMVMKSLGNATERLRGCLKEIREELGWWSLVAT